MLLVITFPCPAFKVASRIIGITGKKLGSGTTCSKFNICEAEEMSAIILRNIFEYMLRSVVLCQTAVGL